MLQKRWKWIVPVLCLIVVLSACGGNDSPSASPSSSGQSEGSSQGTIQSKTEPVTLNFVYSTREDPTPYQPIFDKFKEETGHTVELQPLPDAEYDNMIKTRFATGDFPDLFHMHPGTKQYVKLRADETLYEWSNDTDVLDRLQDFTRQNQVLDGEIYGIPWGQTSMMGILYNKKIFEEVGVQPPTNYADLLDIAQKIKDAGYTPFYESVQNNYVQIFYFTGWVSYVDQEIGEEGVLALNENRLRLTEIPSLRNLFERQLDFKERGFYQDDVLAGTYDEMQNEFGENRAAMVFMLEAVIPQLVGKFGESFVTDNVGFFPFPSEDGEGVAMTSPPSQLMVPKEAKNRDVAIELVKFMTRPEIVDQWYSMQPGIPIFKDAKSELYPVQQTVLEHIEKGNSMLNIQNRLTPTFKDFAKTLQKMFIDGNIDEAINDFDVNYRADGRSKQLPGFE